MKRKAMKSEPAMKSKKALMAEQGEEWATLLTADAEVRRPVEASSSSTAEITTSMKKVIKHVLKKPSSSSVNESTTRDRGKNAQFLKRRAHLPKPLKDQFAAAESGAFGPPRTAITKMINSMFVKRDDGKYDIVTNNHVFKEQASQMETWTKEETDQGEIREVAEVAFGGGAKLDAAVDANRCQKLTYKGIDYYKWKSLKQSHTEGLEIKKGLHSNTSKMPPAVASAVQRAIKTFKWEIGCTEQKQQLALTNGQLDDTVTRVIGEACVKAAAAVKLGTKTLKDAAVKKSNWPCHGTVQANYDKFQDSLKEVQAHAQTLDHWDVFGKRKDGGYITPDMVREETQLLVANIMQLHDTKKMLDTSMKL